jgi:CRP/FNR family cyclic AMP-dependent transcriptional regulator
MPEIRNEKFDPLAFLAKSGGTKGLSAKGKAVIFSRGDEANAVFYIQSGRAKLTVVSKGGKQATITLLSGRDFVGEESVTAVAGPRLAAGTAITACSVLKITRDETKRVNV